MVLHATRCRIPRQRVVRFLPQLMTLLRKIALAVDVLAVVLFAVAGPGTRLGVWGFPTGLGLLKWAAFAGIAGVVLTLVALAFGRPRAGTPARTSGRSPIVLWLGLVAAAAVVYVPWQGLQRARALPPIHDVTTDTQDPPAFVAVLPLRAGAANPAAYGGERVAALQRAGYPDLHPVHLTMAPSAAFARALAAAQQMGWAVVAADSGSGRVEATATTRWFGFKDDVVVRVRAEGAGSRVDVRSVSRVGASDVGTNAARIRAYIGRLMSA